MTLKRKHAAWVDTKKCMKAVFPECSACSTKELELKELLRKLKTKAVACEKKADLTKTGGSDPETGEVSEEILALLNIIGRDLEQIRNTVDDDAPALTVLVKEDGLMYKMPVTNRAYAVNPR